MTIALIHNRYRLAGGEDTAFQAEAGLLESRGHKVVRYTVSNDDIRPHEVLFTGIGAIWNRREARRLREVLRASKTTVAHFHNTFPRISPSGYSAAHDAGAAVVQTLHNFRLICPGATLFRDGRPCEECVGSVLPGRGVLHGCYRGSRLYTAVPAAVSAVHNLRGTWHRDVDIFVTPSEFASRKLASGGLPAAKIIVKPNFVATDPGAGPGRGGYALFAGRLSPEKGAGTLVRAWPMITGAARLIIAGDGPEASQIRNEAAGTGIEFVGWQTTEALRGLLQEANMVIVPSQCDEVCPQIVIEAFATGAPVVAAKRGALPELVEHGRTGRLFDAGNPTALAAEIDWMLSHADEVRAMRFAARAEYEAKYSAEENYRRLLAVYARASAERQAS
jgi:glycosyltransferase involved in cell wall biosynthesis